MQCNLLLVDLNGECGRMNSPTFGTDTRTTAAINPAILNGWSVRPADWQIGASIQQELMPRVSLSVDYWRTWFLNQVVVQQRAYSLADFDTFSITAPRDPRLPVLALPVTFVSDRVKEDERARPLRIGGGVQRGHRAAFVRRQKDCA